MKRAAEELEPEEAEGAETKKAEGAEADADDDTSLSPEQQEVVSAILAGQSVFFTGPAGTGKSRILKRLTEELEERKMISSTYFTATTGIAALNIGGKTLDKFVGCGLINEWAQTCVDKIL